jgi:hypothetical protein
VGWGALYMAFSALESFLRLIPPGTNTLVNRSRRSTRKPPGNVLPSSLENRSKVFSPRTGHPQVLPMARALNPWGCRTATQRPIGPPQSWTMGVMPSSPSWLTNPSTSLECSAMV